MPLTTPSRFPGLSGLAIGFLAAAAFLATAPSPAFAAPAAPAKKEAPKPPLQIAFDNADKLFQAGKHREAIKAFTDFSKKFEAEIKKITEMNKDEGNAINALVHLRLASSCQALKEWKAAEEELLIFLKYPKGTGNLLSENNDYVLTAQIVLADVYGQQQKWDEAIKSLDVLRRKHALNNADKVRLTIAYVKALVGKAEVKGPTAAKATIQESIDNILNPIIAARNYLVPEIKETAIYVVELYTKLGKAKEARGLSDAISAAAGSPLDRAMANFQRLEIGERLFQQAEELGADAQDAKQRIYRQCLTTFQETLRAAAMNALLDDAQRIQDEKVAKITKDLASQVKSQDEEKAANAKAEIAKAEAERDVFKKAVESFQKNTDYNGFLSYRIALCLLEIGRPWEAYIAFRDIFDNNPKFSRMSIAHYYCIRALRAMNRNKEAQASCRDFLTKYPGAQEVGDVAVLNGEISFDVGDYGEAIKQFRWARENVKSLSVEYKEWIDWYLVSAYFQFVEWEAALKEVEAFMSHYPKSQQMEEIVYLRGLCYFFQGKYPETLAGFGVTDPKGYLARYPNGKYVPDAKYRLALVKFGLKPDPKEIHDFKRAHKRPPAAWEIANNGLTEKEARDWLKTYEKPAPALKEVIDKQRPEVETLLGDVYFRYFEDRTPANTDAEKQKNLKRAIDCYVRAALGSKDNPQTFDFVTRELNRRLPSQGEWGKMLEIYNTFYKWDPDGSKALGHLYWILRAVEKLGKTPEERRAAITKEGIKDIPDEYLTKPADDILAAAILRNINDYRKENVEQLIGELVSRVVRKTRGEVQRRAVADGIAKADIVKVTLKEASDKIAEKLKYTEPNPKNIVAARTYYARAQVARALKNEKAHDEDIARIAAIYKEEELSPAILAECVDILLAQKNYEKADAYSQYILDHWRSSDYADVGFLGKGEVLLAKKDNKQALDTLKEAVDNDILLGKEKEVRLAYARALIEVGGKENLEIAAKTLKDGSANKQWRGEYTAWCLYYLGQIEEKKLNDNEAINYYRRCSLSWKKHGVVTAKAYIRVIKLFQKKRDSDGVGGTIWDMLQEGNPASNQPEADEVRALRGQYPYTPKPIQASSTNIPPATSAK